MEGLIGILVWIVFIFISIARHVSKTNDNRDSQRKSIDRKIEDFFSGKQNLEGNLEEAREDETFGSDSMVNIDNQKQVTQYPASRKQETRLEKQTRRNKEITKPFEKKKRMQQYPLFDDLATEKAILQGVIFKEILGPPRAKNPYRYGSK